MMLRHALVGAMALACVAVPAQAADVTAQHCSNVAAAKQAVANKHGRWAKLTSEQWQFVRGVYAFNPQTPEGLPLGDSAALIQIEGAALIVFLDGDQACGGVMPIPEPIVALLIAVGSGEVRHAGQSE